MDCVTPTTRAATARKFQQRLNAVGAYALPNPCSPSAFTKCVGRDLARRDWIRSRLSIGNELVEARSNSLHLSPRILKLLILPDSPISTAECYDITLALGDLF